MALTPQNNEVFMREVDEELRRDEMIAFGRKYGVWIVGLIVLVLIALGGTLWWRYHRQTVAGETGERFQTALDALGSGDTKAASKTLDTLADSRNDAYRAMATFSQADILLGKDDLKGAAAKFASIANDASIARPFRDLALIRETSAEYDSLKPDVVVNRLRPLAVKGNPWFGSAGEMVAIAYIRMGRRDLAGKMFSQIAQDDTVPDTIRQRAVQMASLMNSPTADQHEDKAAQ